MKIKISTVLVAFSILLMMSCKSKSNEEKIIEEYLTSIQNEDGSISKVELGKYTFHSFENIDVDGKFIYALIEADSNKVTKENVKEKIEENLKAYNKHLLYSAIAFKRSLNCSLSEWSEEIEYKQNAEKYQEEALDFHQEAYRLGKIYNNFNNTLFVLIKTVYDYKLNKIDTTGITKYFVYDKENNKIVGVFNLLDQKFVAYYYKSVEGLDIDKGFGEVYEYKNLLDLSLDDLVALVSQ